MIETLIVSTESPAAVSTAHEVLSQGGLVAFPTDTVYGLAASVLDRRGIERLFEAKARAASKAIAVLIGDLDQLAQITPGLTPSAERLAQRFWPGALTLVVPKHPGLPDNLSPLPTIGARMPDHGFARALLRFCGPLATSSANLSGGANPQNALEVLEHLRGRIELVIDGGTVSGGVPSTVVDCTTDQPRILRHGAISAEAILELFQ